MGKDCCAPETEGASQRWIRILQIALVLNLTMFFVESFGSYLSRSSSLQADSLDFLGDALNYGVSLYVANKALSLRSAASLIKGWTMTAFGVFVLVRTTLSLAANILPEAPTMGWIGSLSLLVNLSVALMLYRYREGDSNMQSVWLCSRNDAIGNIAVLFAAFLVSRTQSGWPDWIASYAMAGLVISSGLRVILAARKELSGST